MENNWRQKAGLFLSSQAISLFGSSLVQYAIIWYITLETQSGTMTTLATLFGFIPQVLITLFAGVWADRYSKKNAHYSGGRRNCLLNPNHCPAVFSWN